MRVMHVGAGSLYGGIERLLASYARLSSDSMEHSFVLCFPGRLLAELTSCGAAVHLAGAVRLSRPWTLWRRRKMGQILQQHKPDVVVCHSVWPHVVFAPVVRAAKRPLVFTAHDVPSGTHWLERLARRTPPDLVLAASRHIAASIDKVFPGVRGEVHYSPVDAAGPALSPDERAALRAERGAKADTAVIIMASRLERWKGHRLLLDALARLNQMENPDWQCWIVGGPQRPAEARYLTELKQAVTATQLGGRVQFLGQRDDVPRLLAAADLHCQPNQQPEPFGIAFVEALHAGLPVVTSDFGGGAEIVNDCCGVLIPPGDAMALATALAALIRDPLRRQMLGAGGPARARELCDPGKVLPKLQCSLERICAHRAPAEPHGATMSCPRTHHPCTCRERCP